MHETLIERMTKTEEDKRLYQQECAILDATELICELMEQKGVSRSELARRLGKSKSYVTRLLAGNANMTVRTLSDVVFVLGSTIRFQYTQAPQETRSADTGASLFGNSPIWAEICQWPLAEMSLPEITCGLADEVSPKLAS